MSYCTQDRHGAFFTNYTSQKSSEVVGTGKTWWPDYGPSLRDHSYQEKYAPHHHIFEKVVKPAVVGKPRGQPLLERQPTQFRHPAPAREAMMMKDWPTNEDRLAAKEVTDRQTALRLQEVRQRKIESWLEPAPIRMASVNAPHRPRSLLRASSEPSLSNVASAKVSRETYERLGYLVGRSKGSIADGKTGVGPRRHNPLSLNSLMFTGSVMEGVRSRSSRSLQPRKPSKQWRLCPESSFVFDPRTCLPVPRGGWNSQPLTSFPEPPAAGHREWVAPVTFDARPKVNTMEALPDWSSEIQYARSPSALERNVTAGTATASCRKHPYGESTPSHERQPWDSQASGFGRSGRLASSDASPLAEATQ